MRDLQRGDSDGYYSASYDELLASFEHPILLKVDDSDYQGDSRVLLQDGDRYGIMIFGWGSCSGCDSLQACNSVEEATELRDELYKGIKWGTAREIREYFENHDWAGDYSWHAEEQKKFIKEGTKIMALEDKRRIGE